MEVVAIVLLFVALAVVVVTVMVVTRNEAAWTRAAIETEAKLIHRRIDDLTGEMQLTGGEIAKLIERRVESRIDTTIKAKKKAVYDYESSQRATLEEFKEQ